MKINLLYILSITALLLGCERNDFNETKPDSPQGNLLSSITIGVHNAAKTRVGIDIDPTQTTDTYFWTEGDQIILCELDDAGTAFTGINLIFAIDNVPENKTDRASFTGFVPATTTGQYIVLHTRNWGNVVLPTAGGSSVSYNLPTLIQEQQITADNKEAAQAFADNLFFSTRKVTGQDLLDGNVSLEHQLVQLELDIDGDAADAGQNIFRVELIPETTDGYAKSLSINAAGDITAIGGETPKIIVADPNAKIGAPYKIRMVVRPVSLISNNGLSVRLYAGLQYSPLSTTATSREFEPGKIYTLSRQVGTLNQTITTTRMSSYATPYVGAFWKKSQRGERRIQIRTLNATADYGDWVAYVAWSDKNWNEGDIVLSKSNMPSRNDVFVPGAEDTEYVLDGKRAVAGYAGTTSSDYIAFKIGLQGEYTPTEDAPARYAIILLSYNNYTKYHLIYIRQGEDDAVIGDGSTVKWSVYNVGNSTNTPPLGAKTTVDFPSQSGYLKKWSQSTNMYSSASNPIAATWNNDGSTISLTDICPDGYKTPSFTALNSGDAASLSTGTEVHQLGYYADGHYDRFYSNNTGYGISRVGFLVVNKITKASLFLPASGYRTSATAASGVNSLGYYLSSTPNGTTNCYILTVTDISNAPKLGVLNNIAKSYAYSVRCVKVNVP